MALTLAFDASAGRCAVGLFESGATLAECAETMERGHAERLFPLIDRCLAAAGRARGEIDLIAVCTGPGNFTGARIGVAAARGLALSLGAEAVGVDRFEALSEGRPGVVAVILEARGGAVHAARFEDGALVGAAKTLQPEEIGELAAGARLIGDGAARIGVAESASGDAPLAALARIAQDRRGAGDRPAPRYLRPTNAALPATPPPPLLG